MPPDTGLYHSPIGLYDHQAFGTARWYKYHRRLVVWETGTGKTHLGMATPALLFEDDKIGLTFVVAEQGKIGEWVEDFAAYTDIEARLYYGDATKRAKIRDDFPSVAVSTYETVRNDASKTSKVKSGNRTITHRGMGPLTEALVEHIRTTGKGICFVYDEVTKLKNRSSENYKSHYYLVKECRKAAAAIGAEVWVAGLTATPIEKDPENAFNEWRFVDPDGAPTVEVFENDYVQYRDPFGRAKFKNIGGNIGADDETREPWVIPLCDRMAYILDVKRKTDPDLVDKFPKMVEEYTYVQMSKLQADFYSECEALLDDHIEVRNMDERALFMVLRQIACHPLAVTYSKGELAARIVAEVGVAGLTKIGAPKLERLLLRMEGLVKGQGAKAVVFSFFGQSVLPLLDTALTKEGYKVALHHGGLTQVQKDAAKARFRYGDADIFLSSDAGSRGLNLPEALYVENYEMALTHATNIQRINRAHRIDSTHASITANSFVLKDTIEEAVVALNIKRNTWHDMLLDVDNDDDGYDHLTAEDRRVLLRVARKAAA